MSAPSLPPPRDFAPAALIGLYERTGVAGWVAAAVVLPWLLIGLAGEQLPDNLALLRHAPWELWQLTPAISLPLLLLGSIYVSGLRRIEARGARPSVLRQASFFGALAAIFAALQSPIEALADHSLSIHMVEHMLLRTAAPALLMLAQPQAVLLRGLPAVIRRRVVAPVAGSRGVRAVFGVLSRPLPATVLFVGNIYVWMLPRYQDLALVDEPIHDLMHATLLITGLFFFWRLFDPRPEPRGPAIGTRLLMIWGAELGNILIGYFLTYSSVPIYPAYARLGLVWGVSPLHNQNYGGQTLWVCGTMMIALSALLVIYLWARDEARHRPHAHDVARAERDPTAWFARQRAGNRRIALGLLGFVAIVCGMMSISVGMYVVHYRDARRAGTSISVNQIP